LAGFYRIAWVGSVPPRSGGMNPVAKE